MVDFKVHKIFGLPPGADFPRALVDGVCAHFKKAPPHHMAQAHIILNTERMLRRVKKLFLDKSNILHPKLHLLTNLAEFSDIQDFQKPVSPLIARFELIELIDRLITAEPDLAARASLFSLSDSLANLIDEMQGEGVVPKTITALDVTDQSGHWERAKNFLLIAHEYLKSRELNPDKERMQRLTVERICDLWHDKPLSQLVILAGSTGSRGTTLKLMKSVVQLPQGALLLPGFDFDLSENAWRRFENPLKIEDHQQARFANILQDTNTDPKSVQLWNAQTAPCPERNALVSLALRPAPVTDTWFAEGPALASLESATKSVTLLEADSPRHEALAIAIRLREAVQEGKIAALISPNRQLTRQVTSALERWDIVPDDSAGVPLHLTAPGRFLRHVSTLLVKDLTTPQLLAIMKHPLTHSSGGRNIHLLLTRELELFLRKKRLPFPLEQTLTKWAQDQNQPEAVAWVIWLVQSFLDKRVLGSESFPSLFDKHCELASEIAAGHDPDPEAPTGLLWVAKAGKEAAKVFENIAAAADHGGTIAARDYVDIVGSILSDSVERDPVKPHPQVLIWGTLEARVQGADLVILGGLNEGSWPKSPNPDPWLNRSMRQSAGLLLPERQIGLSAHDFQQAIAVGTVWLTRAKRDDDSETVPSRWLNRVINLLSGLHDNKGPERLLEMRQRGEKYLKIVQNMEETTASEAAKRSSPRPPVTDRPLRLSVTEIKTLICDPYAIYAKHILGLRPLENLEMGPDPRLRGEITHKAFEKFVKIWDDIAPQDRKGKLIQIFLDELSQNAPWAVTRLFWRSRVEALVDWFLQMEELRQANFAEGFFEETGKIFLAEQNLTLISRADRLHRHMDGTLGLYDYKTGSVPTKKQQQIFDKQLYLMAAIAENGGFEKLGAASVSKAAFIGLGTSPKEETAPFDEEPLGEAWDKFKALISSYRNQDQGYTPRRALFSVSDRSDYDQLSRFGEWEIADNAVPEDLT
ncbi:MAG: double-strand break repair protein AddB [Paracoccaceae bacterium]|nr:double-strand break repair protein AddB [Paracoccaceae bacterium]